MKKIISFFLISTFVILSSCSKDKPTEPTNNAPNIQSFTASPSPIKVNETTSLTCVATDLDGDSLTYYWSSDNGTFPNGTSGFSTTWRAPSKEGTYNIKVIVSDGKEMDQKEKNIIVSGRGVPCPGIATVTYSGKTYNTVQIGDQCWLKENLDIGTMVSSDSSGDNQTDNGKIEKYCYDNNLSNCNTYGGLYQWNESMQYVTTEGTQGICPSGWHIPTQGEYKTLKAAVDDSSNALKAIGQGTGSGAGTNTSGFSALLAGYRNWGNGDFGRLGTFMYFWSSTENGSSAYYMTLIDNNDNVIFTNSNKDGGFSVRCLKD